MNTHWTCAALGLLVSFGATRAAEPAALPGDREPVLRLEAGGPTAFVTSLAFSPDGETLYAAGFDKVVRAWTYDRAAKQFALSRAAYRVPVGPGPEGALNALAVSPDGAWLAAAGTAVIRGGSTFRQPGVILPKLGGMTDEMWRDQGTIYVFDTKTGAARLLRGHAGPVLALAFAPARNGPPLLVSCAREAEGNGYAGAARLWDVAAARELDRLGGLPDPGARRPGLAIWPAGDGGPRVALAWPHADPREPGDLHLWDAGQPGRKPQAGRAGSYNGAVAFVPGQGRLLTGSTRREGGRLQEWEVTAGGGLRPDPRPPAGLPRGWVLQTLALFSSRPGGPADRAAAAVRVAEDGKESDLLYLFDPAAPGKAVARVALWQDSPYESTVAADRGGRFLAAAGSPGHEIKVFAAEDLLAGRPRPLQTLASAGATLRYAAPVKKGDRLGLVLGEGPAPAVGQPPRAPRAGDLIFDVTGRALGGDVAGWQLDAAAADPAAARLALTKAGFADPQRVTAYALLAASRDKPAVLAVAYLDAGDTVLALYDAASGQPVRQFSGHVNPVSWLSFSADGRLLVSAAEDQTVRVWSLAGLDKSLGQLRGLSFRDPGRGGGPVVALVGSDRFAPENFRNLRDKKVQAGDMFEGFVTPAGLERVASTGALLEAVARRKPGETVTLRFVGRGDVPFKVGRHTDEQKPLLSLFVTRGGRPEGRHWLGWSPHGPYDASDRKAEGYVGWHTNTGRAEAPVSFRGGDQYRQEFFRPGVLKHLLAAGDVGGALGAWEREPAPRPVVNARLEADGPGRADRQGNLVVRKPRRLAAEVCNIPMAKVAWVKWQRGRDEPRDFDRADGGEFEADLEKLTWERGAHELRVLVRTREAVPQTYWEPLRLHYLPTPPRVAFDRPADRPLQVTDAQFVVEAEVRAGAPGQKVKAVLRHGGRSVPVAGPRVKQEITLRPGLNLIALRAENDGAAPEFADEFESATRTLEVVYRPPAPQAVVTSVEPAAPGADPPATGKAVVVHRRKVRVRGTLVSEEGFTEATLGGRPLGGFKRGDKTCCFDHEVELPKPGEHTLRLLAKTALQEAQPVALVLDYRPEPPALERLADEVLDRAPDGPVTVRLGRLLPPEAPFSFAVRARVSLRGDEVKSALDWDKTRTLTAEARLRPGANVFKVRVELPDQAGPSFREEEVRVYCRQRPEVTVEAPAKDGAVSDRPFVEVRARVAAPADLPPTFARVNDRDAEVRRVADGVWQVEAKDVPLREGDNEVRVRVGNADGEGVATRGVVYRKPPEPKKPPVVRVLGPEEDRPCEDARFPVRFRVTSDSKLARVAVLRGEEELYRAGPQDVKEEKEAGKTVYRVEAEPALALNEGANRLVVVAVNEGGEARADRTLTYVRKGVRVLIDRLELAGPDGRGTGRFLRVKQDGSEVTVLDEADEAVVLVHGRADWPDEADKALRGAVRVLAFVNSFKQAPAWLEEREPNQRTRRFVVPVRLTRARDNEVEIAIPDVRTEHHCAPGFSVHCKRPQTEQRLHLLIVGVGEKDRTELVGRALKALAAADSVGSDDGLAGRLLKPFEGEPGWTASEFRTPAFREGRLYRPLTEDVTCGAVYGALGKIKGRIRPAGGLNDVVVVYYAGPEAVGGPTEHYLLTDYSAVNRNYSESAIDCNGLRRLLAEASGAKLLLLDVRRAEGGPAGQGPAPWGEEFPRLGVLRYVWLSRGDTPAEATLLGALEDSLRQAVTLKAVRQQLEDRADRLRRRHEGAMRYESTVPPQLEALVIGYNPSRE